MSAPGIGLAGQQGVDDGASHFNAIMFLIQSFMGTVNVATMVQIVDVYNFGGDVKVGYVDILPLVNQVDQVGNAVPHGVVFNVPYFRLQGGSNAVILDPQVGDIGIAVFADRDTTQVEASLGQANPGSGRRFDMADAMYIGGLLNGVPTQYVQFNTSGITVVSPTQITVQAPNIALNGNVASVGTFLNNGVDIGSPHTHGGVTSGGSRTTGPA